MTTIVSNGYYLVADNRGSINSDYEGYNSSTNKKEKTVFRSDSVIKINIPKNKIKFKDSYLMAYANTGYLSNGDLFRDVTDSISNPNGTEFNEIRNLLNNVFTGKDLYIVGVLSCNKTVTITKHTSSELSVSTYKPNDYVTAGSGSGMLDELLQFNKDIKIDEVIPFASRFDKATSPTYSAFSVEENHLYAYIDIPNEEVLEITKRNFDKAFGNYGYNNPSIKPL